MKKIKIITFLFSMLMLSSAYSQNKETRQVGEFAEINFAINGTLFLQQGNNVSVKLEGSKEVLDKIETKVKGDEIEIKKDEDWKFWKNNEENIKVYITVKNLNALRVSGSGKVIVNDTFKTGELALKVSGSGQLNMKADAIGLLTTKISGSGRLNFTGTALSMNGSISGSGKLDLNIKCKENSDIQISGSGDISVSGTSQSMKIQISGSGSIHAEKFMVNTCDVKISGSGDAMVHVTKKLNASIFGSGNVRYSGSPNVEANTKGSGKVKPI